MKSLSTGCDKKWKCVCCSDPSALSCRHDDRGSPEALPGRTDLLRAPDPAGPAQGGGRSAGG